MYDPRIKPKLIAFSGPKGSGKDTAASILFAQNAPNHLFERTPFAGQGGPDPYGVKGICNIVFGYPADKMDDFAFKETKTAEWPHIEPRWPMMDIANWFRDHYGPDIWVRSVERRIQNLKTTPWACVMTDHRFPEELEWLTENNALILYIERPEAESSLQAKQASGDAMALNPSEKHYQQIRNAPNTIVIQNSGSISQLHNTVLMEVRSRFGYWYPGGI